MDALRKNFPPESIDVCVYHNPCSDGTAAAMCALLAKPSVVLHPARYPSNEAEQQRLLKIVGAGQTVLIVDYSYSRAFTESLWKLPDVKVLVLDHHATAVETLSGLPYVHLDMHKSGCILAWDFFFGQQKWPVPRFLRFIEDRDLWRWSDSRSRAFCAALYNLLPLDPRVYMRFLKHHYLTGSSVTDGIVDDDAMLELFVQKGGYCAELIDAMVAGKVERARVYQTISSLPPRTYAVVQDSGAAVSDIGDCLSRRHDYALIWDCVFDGQNTAFKVSVRTRRPRSARKLAEMFGGGGHVEAAAFIWTGVLPNLFARLQCALIDDEPGN